MPKLVVSLDGVEKPECEVGDELTVTFRVSSVDGGNIAGEAVEFEYEEMEEPEEAETTPPPKKPAASTGGKSMPRPLRKMYGG